MRTHTPVTSRDYYCIRDLVLLLVNCILSVFNELLLYSAIAAFIGY